MIIKWLGHSSFFIQSSGVSLITDPFNPSIGLSFPDISANIITISHDHFDHSYREGIKGNPQIIDSAGDYELNNIQIEGIKSFHDSQNGTIRGNNIIFKYNIEDMNIAHLGDLGHILSDEQINNLIPTDIVMIPVGGTYTIGPDDAIKVIRQINPKIIIPMHYHTSNLEISSLSTLDTFIQKNNLPHETLSELSITKDQLPAKPKIIVFRI